MITIRQYVVQDITNGTYYTGFNRDFHWDIYSARTYCTELLAAGAARGMKICTGRELRAVPISMQCPIGHADNYQMTAQL